MMSITVSPNGQRDHERVAIARGAQLIVRNLDGAGVVQRATGYTGSVKLRRETRLWTTAASSAETAQKDHVRAREAVGNKAGR